MGVLQHPVLSQTRCRMPMCLPKLKPDPVSAVTYPCQPPRFSAPSSPSTSTRELTLWAPPFLPGHVVRRRVTPLPRLGLPLAVPYQRFGRIHGRDIRTVSNQISRSLPREGIKDRPIFAAESPQLPQSRTDLGEVMSRPLTKPTTVGRNWDVPNEHPSHVKFDGRQTWR